MKNLNPTAGFKQLTTGNIYLPRGMTIDLIKNKKIKFNEIGYYFIAATAADWNQGEYRFGLIRHSLKDLAIIFNVPHTTLAENFNKLAKKGLLIKKENIFKVKNFDYFQNPKAYKNKHQNNEILKQLTENSVRKTEKSEFNSEISYNNLSKRSKNFKVAIKVGNKVSNRSAIDYQKIHNEESYAFLSPEDMKWIDEHILANGGTLP